MTREVRGPLGGLHRNVVALGVTSLLTDVSSEMIVPVMPLFVTATLGASVISLGLIEGVAESTASLLRLASGWLSDRSGRRKPLVVGGYGLSALAKAGFAAATTWAAVLLLRFADRVGKGLRNPPRDALIADSVATELRGRAYGLHRALDSLGAAIGPLVAVAVLAAFPGDYRRVFLVSFVPALLGIAVLAWFVRAPRGAAAPRAATPPTGAPARAFRRFLVADGLFQLGNSSMAFVLLRASQAGLTPVQVPLAYMGYNLAYALGSYPAGALADRAGRRGPLLAAYLLYALVYALLAWRSEAVLVVGALLLLGVHSALLEVSQRSLVADLAGPAWRGTAFGIYHTVVGLALLPASLVAGWLWQRVGPQAPFALGAALALAAALAFVVLLPARHEARDRTHDAAV
jgi:MFS family permease